MTAIAATGLGAPELLRGSSAPPPRTLIDIIRRTAADFADEIAVDAGSTRLTYRELLCDFKSRAADLNRAGIGRGDRVGIRVPSGTADLYCWILAVMAAGAAYVPVDFDDPAERASVVFAEAQVAAVISAEGLIEMRGPIWEPRTTAESPGPDDDAWIIFTSGSTGVPKGVAVTHRSAAALVDAEARKFLQGPGVAGLGPNDRVLAGLSVAFDASCEEMWLAWRHGAALVPAPRALVRAGADLCGWLVEQGITVVSTVPTLAAQWPVVTLEQVRLLIFGGEVCPSELVAKLLLPGREVWNTYGPTETTVVACATELTDAGLVRIGLPLDGWDLAVIDQGGRQVAPGCNGELVIGGVGLARYLDDTIDAEKFVAMPQLGWDRGYRTGDVVRYESEGLVFVGRSDGQIKLGGRRIELGEIDAALLWLPGVSSAAAAIRQSSAGNPILIGYVVVDSPGTFDAIAAARALRHRLPAGTVPLVAVVDALPTKTSGKVDRDLLPWPVPGQSAAKPASELSGTAAWIAAKWQNLLGATVLGPDDDFFDCGGGSLTAAALVSALRERFPAVTVADIYAVPGLAALAATLDAWAPAIAPAARTVSPTPLRSRIAQTLLAVPLAAITGLRWLVYLLLLNNLVHAFVAVGWLPVVSWWIPLVGAALLISPPGVILLTVIGARSLLFRLVPGVYRRGGSVHLRLWFAERLAEAMGANCLIGAPLVAYYARGLGVDVGQDTDLHSLPPITGMLTLGRGSSINTEVDLSGYWLDGDQLHVGRIVVGDHAVVGSRSILMPGAIVGDHAQVAAGSAVSGTIGMGEHWAGSPATPIGDASTLWPVTRPPRTRGWNLAYAIGAVIIGALPVISLIPGLVVLSWWLSTATTLTAAARSALLAAPLFTALSLAVYLTITGLCVRLLGMGLREGFHAVRGRTGWQVWCTEKLMDAARTFAYPVYSSLLTPTWLRLLGAKIGRGVEASTVIMLPKMTTVGSGAFLADDTMVGSYELGGGWLRIERSKVGKGAFLGNSGMTAAGRQVPKRGLVAVLSAAPAKARSGTSWLGSPPVQLRRTSADVDRSRTYEPPLKLKVARSLVEACRLLPATLTVAIGIGVLFTLNGILANLGLLPTALLAGPVLLVAGVVAAATAVVAKWVLLGRLTAKDRPLWSSFVWRNELADTFVELVAVPWLPRGAAGAPALNWLLRALGATIGRGVWLESYWLPEADLVTIGDGATVNRGCVLQTHLFHDRIMSMDTVSLDVGSTLGPHSVILPAAGIGAGATVGPASLVMRGDRVPAGSRWIGNPIVGWQQPISTARPHR